MSTLQRSKLVRWTLRSAQRAPLYIHARCALRIVHLTSLLDVCLHPMPQLTVVLQFILTPSKTESPP
jgi:hypothetical protein